MEKQDFKIGDLVGYRFGDTTIVNPVYSIIGDKETAKIDMFGGKHFPTEKADYLLVIENGSPDKLYPYISARKEDIFKIER